MITLFRNFAKSKWATGLLVVVALGLLFTGGQHFDIVGAITPRHVIDAGDRHIDQAAFRADFDRERENQQQQAQRPVSLDDLIKANFHLRYLDARKNQLGFLDWAWKAGIRPGKELVVKQIRKYPRFFDSVTGQFSEETYRAALAEMNLTPAMAEQDLRDSYIAQHYQVGLAAGARLPRIYGAMVANQAMESRDARWFTITRAMVGTAPAPTDAQLAAFMQQNAADLRRPELRLASLVLFGSAPGSTPAVSEADIQKRFDFRKDALSQPEKRTFVTLTAPSKAVADKIAAALRAGQTPAAAGGANGVQPSEFNSTPQAAMGDPAVGAAVFGLAAGQVSDPIQGRVGFTVAKVSTITPGRPVTLAEVRDQLVGELRAEAERGLIFERVTKYDDARKAGKTLEQAAETAGARIVHLPPVTREGRMANGQQLPQPILDNVWKLGKGAESEAIDAGQGQYFVLRVDNVLPSALPPLAEVRTDLANAWTRRENARLLADRANALEARIRAGQDISAVAASVGAAVTVRADIRTRPLPTDISQGVLQGVFSSGRGEVFSGAGTGDAYVVGRVDRITAAVPVLAAPLAEEVRPRMTQQAVASMADNAINVAAARVKARSDLAQARLALGLPAEDAAAPVAGGAQPAAPAPAQ